MGVFFCSCCTCIVNSPHTLERSRCMYSGINLKQPKFKFCVGKRKQGKALICSLSLWDKHCSRSDKYCLRSKREGWGEGSKREKWAFDSINNIAHPHPVPPPLRASPCGGGGFRFYPQTLNQVLSQSRKTVARFPSSGGRRPLRFGRDIRRQRAALPAGTAVRSRAAAGSAFSG